MSAWIKDEAGEVWARAEGQVVATAGTRAEGWLGRPVIAQSLALALPPGLLAGDYRIEVAPLEGVILALEEVKVAASTWVGGMDLAARSLADEAIFAGSLQLRGYEATVSGCDLALDLLWTATSELPAGINFFVHLVDDRDHILAQHDGPLAARPGRAGELARQRVRISLPEGDGTIYVGLYDGQTGQRLPLMVNGALAAEGRYLLTTIQR